MKNPAASGRKFEHRVKRSLEVRGFTVIRSAGSRGPADLVALKSQNGLCRVHFIQAKRGRIKPSEVRALADFAMKVGAQADIVQPEGKELKWTPVVTE